PPLTQRVEIQWAKLGDGEMPEPVAEAEVERLVRRLSALVPGLLEQCERMAHGHRFSCDALGTCLRVLGELPVQQPLGLFDVPRARASLTRPFAPLGPVPAPDHVPRRAVPFPPSV